MTKEKELRLEIDLFKLEEEWQTQPTLVRHWSAKMADAQYDYDEAKREVELTGANLAKQIRDDPESFGLKKVTEDGVKATVILQDEYQEAVKKQNQARHTLGLREADVEGLQQRKRALTMEVELYTKDYYSEPTSRPASKEGEEYTKRLARRRGKADRNEDESDDD